MAFPVISALEEGYKVEFVADASGGASIEAHETAKQRMIQAGAVPVTWEVVLSEFQRDWTRQKTYQQVGDIAKQHAGAWGSAINYASAMLPKAK